MRLLVIAAVTLASEAARGERAVCWIVVEEVEVEEEKKRRRRRWWWWWWW